MTTVTQADFARALLDPERAAPAGLTSFNGSDPAQRFAVYRNNVTVSLIDALAVKFPVTQALVGEEFFRAMARLYVRQSPPVTRQMMRFGASFPDYIAGFEPAGPVPYLADVARLESLRIAVYHAADAAPLSLGALAGIQADNLAAAKLTFIPALHCLVSPYAVASLWAAHQGILRIEEIDPFQSESVIIARPEMDITVIPAAPSLISFIEYLRNGASLGSATDAVLDDHPDFDPAQAFQVIVQHQLAMAIHAPEQQ